MSTRRGGRKSGKALGLHPGDALLALLSALLLVLSFAHSVDAAPGDLDTTFGTGGRVVTDFGGSEETPALALQPDGRIVVAGSSFLFFGFNFALARYNPDGTLDLSFGQGGRVLTSFGRSERARSLALQPDGRIVVAGSSGFDFALARYNPDGSLDSSFGVGGKVTTDFSGTGRFEEEAHAVALQPDGKIVVAGTADEVGPGDFDFALARYNLDGSLDSSFGVAGLVLTDLNGNGSFDEASALVLQPDGKIVVAGSVEAPRGPGLGFGVDFALARYNPDGSLDSSFGVAGVVLTDLNGNGSFDRAHAVALQPDGKIVVAGSSSDGGFALARYHPDGSLDSSFGTEGVVLTDVGGEARALVLQADGKIVVAGSGAGSSNADFALARYNANGSLDDTFGVAGLVLTDLSGNGTDQAASALVLQPDGKIVVVGTSSFPDGPSDFALARYEGDANTNTPTGSDIVVDLAPARLIFTNVTQAGVTSLTTSSTGPPPPAGFKLGNPPTYFNLATTASFSGSVSVCINYSGIAFDNVNALRLMHFEGAGFVDVTFSLDTTAQVICGRTASLSPFVIVEPAVVPFASLTARVRVEAEEREFEVKGTFTPGAGSDGIRPLTEEVTLQVGSFTATIPAGSFRRDGRDKFKFKGIVGGVRLEVKIEREGKGFEFKAEGKGAQVGRANPVTLRFAVGNDAGSASVRVRVED